MTTLTLTQRDVLGANAATGNVSTFGTETQLVEWRARQDARTQRDVEYLISANTIRTPKQSPESIVSPAWLGRIKQRLKSFVGLPVNWDSYGGLPANPTIVRLAESLAEWFAVDGVPPPDVFACGDGGVQFEWHIRGVDITIDFSTSEDEPIINYHDVSEGSDPWSSPVSNGHLQTARKRLLQNR